MNRPAGPDWPTGIVALAVAGACLGLLAFLLWPR